MNKNLKIKILPALWWLFVGIVISYNFVRYIGVEWEKPFEYTRIVRMTGRTLPIWLIAEAVIILLIFVVLINRKGIRATIVSKCALILLVLGVLWTMYSAGKGISLLYYDSNPFLLIEIAVIMIVLQRQDLRAQLFKYIFVLATFYTLYSMYNAFDFRNTYPLMRMSNGIIIQTFAYALFLVAIWNAVAKKSKRNTVLIYSCCASLVITSIIITSRGWMIQAIGLTFFCYYSNSNKTARQKLSRGLVAVLLFVALYYYVVTYMSDSLGYILGRFSEETRANQLESFFSQVPISSLIIGRGMDATYFFNGTDYAYVDNQFLFWMFRYGIVSVTAYWIPIFFSVFRKKRDGSVLEKNASFPIIMWILAMGGLCIYYGLFLDIGHIYILAFMNELLDQKGLLRTR